MQVWKEAAVKDEENSVELLLGLNKLLCNPKPIQLVCSSFDVNVAAPIAAFMWSCRVPFGALNASSNYKVGI